MPSRVRNHVLETLSRDAFSRQISGPLGWVVRDISIDYGIDVEVEVFETNGDATGLTFKVQLKGMERPDHIGPYRNIKVDHFRYWNRLDVPVLLIAYDDSTGTVFGRWIHSLDLNLKPEQKTVRIRFQPEDAIAEGDARLRTTIDIVRRLRSGSFGRPYPLHLLDASDRRQTHDYFEVVRELGLEDFVRLDRSSFSFAVSIDAQSVRVALPGDVGSFTLSRNAECSHNDSVRDSLLILAGHLSRLNRFGECMQMVRKLVGNCRATASPELAIELATAAYEVGDPATLITLTMTALETSAFAAAQMYLLCLRQMPGTEWLDDCRDLLEPSIERAIASAVSDGKPTRAAFWAYNYAQFLYGKEARAESRHWIERAIGLDPGGYGNRPEPRRLLGGIAWFAGDMSKSVEAYQTAVDLGGLEAAGSQLADSLMHAGRYAEARSYISQVLEAGSTNWRDWFVDAVVEELVEHLGLSHQDRREFPAAGTPLSGLPLPTLEGYLIEGDALNPSVWLARCLEHPVERLTTLMTGAFLTNFPVLMAMAVHSMLHGLAESPSRSADENLLAGLLSDQPEVKRILLSDDAPRCSELEDSLLRELALRSLELSPETPGVQLVDENNLPVDLGD